MTVLTNPWSWSGRIPRRVYLANGALLFAVKFVLDWGISRLFGYPWNPMMYLSYARNPLLQGGFTPGYLIALSAAALPFVAAGICLSARRLRDIGAHPFWSGLFFLPFLHLVFFLFLSVSPSDPDQAPGPSGERLTRMLGRPPEILIRWIPRSAGTAFLFGFAASLAFGLLCFGLAAVNAGLGGGLFMATPFGMGFLAAFCAGYRSPLSAGRAVLYGFMATVGGLMLLLAVGIEGVACLIMAAPIVIPMGVFGALIGWACSLATVPRGARSFCLLLGPLLIGWESAVPPEPEPLSVVSTVVIAAPPEVVWRRVVSFPPIDAPPDPVFALVAAPLEARIDGHDPGATRRCIFTIGEFIEPIEVWDEPRELTFGVRVQPEHLGRYLDVRRGQFLLSRNPDGTTTLRGTTWYRLKVFPTAYWEKWTDTLLHAIHGRVLDHIRRLCENPRREIRSGRVDPRPAWMREVNETCKCTKSK